MVSFKAFAKAGEHTPDRFIEYTHVNLYDIADKNVYILDYELFESKNLAKYDNDNARGVIMLIEVADSGEKYTAVTHAKSIVRVFDIFERKGITAEKIAAMEQETIQFHLGKTTANGKEYPQWQII